jgi:hypothetical protein
MAEEFRHARPIAVAGEPCLGLAPAAQRGLVAEAELVPPVVCGCPGASVRRVVEAAEFGVQLGAVGRGLQQNKFNQPRVEALAQGRDGRAGGVDLGVAS